MRMNVNSRSVLLLIAIIGLSSCVQTPKPVAIEERNTFVHVAVLHDMPVEGEAQSDPRPHIHHVLDKAGIRHFIESSSGDASIFVEPKRSNDASLALANDAWKKEYRITIDHILIDDTKAK